MARKLGVGILCLAALSVGSASAFGGSAPAAKVSNACGFIPNKAVNDAIGGTATYIRGGETLGVGIFTAPLPPGNLSSCHWWYEDFDGSAGDLVLAIEQAHKKKQALRTFKTKRRKPCVPIPGTGERACFHVEPVGGVRTWELYVNSKKLTFSLNLSAVDAHGNPIRSDKQAKKVLKGLAQNVLKVLQG